MDFDDRSIRGNGRGTLPDLLGDRVGKKLGSDSIALGVFKRPGDQVDRRVPDPFGSANGIDKSERTCERLANRVGMTGRSMNLEAMD